MRFYKTNPSVAAYKAFTSDNEFKKLKLLAHEIRVIQLKQGCVRFMNIELNEKRTASKLNERAEKIVEIKKALANKYDFRAVLAGREKHENGVVSALKGAGKILAGIATIAASSLLIDVAFVYLFSTMKELTQEAMMMFGTLVGNLVGIPLLGTLGCLYLESRMPNGTAAKIAARLPRPTMEAEQVLSDVKNRGKDEWAYL